MIIFVAVSKGYLFVEPGWHDVSADTALERFRQDEFLMRNVAKLPFYVNDDSGRMIVFPKLEAEPMEVIARRLCDMIYDTLGIRPSIINEQPSATEPPDVKVPVACYAQRHGSFTIAYYFAKSVLDQDRRTMALEYPGASVYIDGDGEDNPYVIYVRTVDISSKPDHNRLLRYLGLDGVPRVFTDDEQTPPLVSTLLPAVATSTHAGQLPTGYGRQYLPGDLTNEAALHRIEDEEGIFAGDGDDPPRG